MPAHEVGPRAPQLSGPPATAGTMRGWPECSGRLEERKGVRTGQEPCSPEACVGSEAPSACAERGAGAAAGGAPPLGPVALGGREARGEGCPPWTRACSPLSDSVFLTLCGRFALRPGQEGDDPGGSVRLLDKDSPPVHARGGTTFPEPTGGPPRPTRTTWGRQETLDGLWEESEGMKEVGAWPKCPLFPPRPRDKLGQTPGPGGRGTRATEAGLGSGLSAEGRRDPGFSVVRGVLARKARGPSESWGHG